MTVTVTADGATLEDALAGLILPAAQPGQPTVDPFPPNPADAPFPSPDRSTIQWLANTTPPGPAGSPYLRDSAGRVWTLAPDPAQGGRVAAFVNGLPRNIPAGTPIVSLIVAGSPAVVWGSLLAGQFFFYNTINGTVIGNLPPPVNVAPPPPPAVPADPPHSAVAPGSSGKVIPAGPSQTIKTLAAGILAAVAGDTLMLDAGATFNESVAWTIPLKIDGQGGVNGVGGAIIDGTGLTAVLARGRGGLVPGADSIIQGLEIRNFAVDAASTGGVAGIRTTDTGCGWLTITNCWIHDCQDGLFGASATVWDIENSLLEHCGLGASGDGFSHNIYLDVETVRLTMKNVVSQNPKKGHALKLRGPVVAVDGSALASDTGSCFDFPNGLTNRGAFTNTIFLKSLAAPDHHIGGYGEEAAGPTNGLAGVRFTTCDLSGVLCQGPFMAMGGGTMTFAADCKLPPTKIAVTGAGTLVGA